MLLAGCVCVLLLVLTGVALDDVDSTLYHSRLPPSSKLMSSIYVVQYITLELFRGQLNHYTRCAEPQKSQLATENCVDESLLHSSRVAVCTIVTKARKCSKPVYR